MHTNKKPNHLNDLLSNINAIQKSNNSQPQDEYKVVNTK